MNLTVSQELWVNETLEKIKSKMIIVAERNQNKIPYTAENGVFNDYSEEKIYWWTNGFWAGIMWQMYHVTENNLYKEIAVKTEQKMDQNFMMPAKLDHDNGFKWLPSAVADYRITGSPDSGTEDCWRQNCWRDVTILRAFLRAWNEWGGEKTPWLGKLLTA